MTQSQSTHKNPVFEMRALIERSNLFKYFIKKGHKTLSDYKTMVKQFSKEYDAYRTLAINLKEDVSGLPRRLN